MKKEEPEVFVNLGYNPRYFLSASLASKLVDILAHATQVEFTDYEDNGYVKHKVTPVDIHIKQNAQSIHKSIEEAEVLDIPLYRYLKEHNLPKD